MDLDEIYDVIAFRIIVDASESQVYAALGIVHSTRRGRRQPGCATESSRSLRLGTSPPSFPAARLVSERGAHPRSAS